MNACRIALVLMLAPLLGADASQPSFRHVDVFIDPHGKALGAYQFELRATSGDVTLVGIEGGEHAAYSHPPYYDPKALLNQRVVIAAFNTGDNLPTTKTRVARVMVRVAEGKPLYDATLQVCASRDASRVDGTITTSEGTTP